MKSLRIEVVRKYQIFDDINVGIYFIKVAKLRTKKQRFTKAFFADSKKAYLLLVISPRK